MKNFLPLLFLACLLTACETEPQATATKTVERYSAEDFYNNISVGSGVFSEDERKLLIHSDESGIFNAYEIDLEDQSKRPLTKSTVESFFVVDYVPGTDDLIYSADKGGNENSHLYLLSADGTTTDLTPGDAVKAQFAGWSKDKKRMYYLTNARNPQFFDLYETTVAEWEPKLIHENNNGMQPAGLSSDGRYLALAQAITTSENKLFLVDTQTGDRTEITDGTGSYGASGFDPENEYFYYTTDVDKEHTYLVKYTLADGTKETLYEGDWSVMYSTVSHTGKYLVIAINEDGKNKLILRDNETGEDIAFPEIPDGDVTSVSFSESDNLMRLSVSSSTTPNDLYVYDFRTEKLTRLTNSLNKDMKEEHLARAEVVRYKSFDGLDIPAIYYKPVDASADNKVPALVWVHGGPGGQSRVGFSSMIQHLVNNGYAVLAVNNRGSSGYGKTFFEMDNQNHGDKDLKDVIWGKKWLQQQDYIDAERIGIIGGSYGGYMTMAAMTFEPDEFKAGVNIFGVTNWLRTLKSIPPYWESFKKALYEEMGDPYTADSVRLYNISPLFHTEKVKNPILVLQGSNDPRVLKIESDEIVEGVRANGGVAEYVVFEDEGHGFAKKENRIRASEAIVSFLDTHLKGEREDG